MENFVHPALFWCDPSAETMYDAENCGTLRKVKMEWAQNRWPKFKSEIEKESYTASDPKFTASDLIIYKDQKGKTLSVSRQNMFSNLVSLILDKTVFTESGTPSAGCPQWFDNIRHNCLNKYCH